MTNKKQRISLSNNVYNHRLLFLLSNSKIIYLYRESTILDEINNTLPKKKFYIKCNINSGKQETFKNGIRQQHWKQKKCNTGISTSLKKNLINQNKIKTFLCFYIIYKDTIYYLLSSSDDMTMIGGDVHVGLRAQYKCSVLKSPRTSLSACGACN